MALDDKSKRKLERYKKRSLIIDFDDEGNSKENNSGREESNVSEDGELEFSFE